MSSSIHPGMRRTRVIHFVGIGGIGMSGIAEVLQNLGYVVRGSDLKASEVSSRLAGLGCDVRIGHAAENVAGVDVVVISSAVSPDNPEVVAAKAHKIPVIRRAEMLAELMRLKFGIAVGGAHGKTTTTSMIAAVLGHAGLDPTVVVGGKVNRFGSNAKLGQGPYLVAEADESDGSFLHLTPTVAVVTNVDEEHLDYYQGGLPALIAAFADFVNRIPFYGLAVVCADDPGVTAMLPKIEKRLVTYGLLPGVDVRATNLRFDGPRTRFDVELRGRAAGSVDLKMLGEHNVRNALAAIAVADELGVELPVAYEGLAGFDGVERRFSVRGVEGDVMVVDDYGHHPAEIRATLAGARRAYPERRLVVGFQPHRYTRTRDQLEAFAEAFDDADRVLLSPIYAAGEAPIAGISADVLAGKIARRAPGKVELATGVEDVAERAARTARSGDLVIFFGAGDVLRASGLVLARLKGGSS